MHPVVQWGVIIRNAIPSLPEYSASSLRPLRSFDRRELFVPRTRTTMAKFRSFSVVVSYLWNRFHFQLVLLSFPPILLRPYLFLKLVSFLRANRTKSASVGPRLLRGAV